MNKTLSRLTTAGLVLASALTALTPLTASAIAAPTATTVTVYPEHLQGWASTGSGIDTRTGGAVNFITDATSPLPNGALQLTTDTTTTSKVQFFHGSGAALSQVSQLSYSTKQNSPTPTGGDASYQLPVYLNGGTSGFSTLVYEPYQNGTVSLGGWQSWNVATGLFWSTRSVTCSAGSVTGTSGGPATYTLAQIKTLCPQAIVIGFGLNVGTNNPSYNVETDAFNFNGTTYNFENAIPTVSTPTITSPANGSVLTTSQLTKIDWTDSTATGNGPVKYQYQAFSNATYTGTPLYDSGANLTTSEIPTTGTPEGIYYVRVRAVDADGNNSTWSNGPANPYKITVKNSPTTFSQCLGTGYQVFSNPAFPNQTSCVLYVARQIINSYRPFFNFNFNF